MENIILYFDGYEEGSGVAEDRNDLPVAVPVASQTLHAVGIGMAIKYRRDPHVVMTFFGDGATSEGDFHEALNFAGVFQTPVIFFCQNNQWAISIPRSKQTRSETLAQKAIAYGIPSIQVDGNDVLAVYVAAKEAVERARNGEGPSLIESVTYRMSVHTTADDPKKYRTEEEEKQWRDKDPIPRFQTYLKGKGLLTDAAIEALEAEIEKEIQAMLERVEEQRQEWGKPEEMFDHNFAELPPTLIRQREELVHSLSLGQEEVEHG